MTASFFIYNFIFHIGIYCKVYNIFRFLIPLKIIGYIYQFLLAITAVVVGATTILGGIALSAYLGSKYAGDKTKEVISHKIGIC